MSEENTTPPISPADDAEPNVPPSVPELERFIFDHDEYRSDIVPRKIEPSKVAKFLLGRIEKNAELRVFVQTEKVVDFYDVNEVVEKFKQFLDKSEGGGEALQRSIVITRIIALAGNANDLEFAKQYANHLIQRADTLAEFEDLIILQNVLGPTASVSPLKQKVQAKIAALESKKDSDTQASVQYSKFKETIAAKVDRVEKAQQIKADVLKTTDRKKRVEEEIKMYLGIEYGFIEYLQSWGTRRLKRETWGAQPTEQVRRVDNSQLRDDVSKLIRNFLDKLPKIAELDGDEKEFGKIRLLRAIKFFGGKVSAEEEIFLEQQKGKQLDILANEGFLLPLPPMFAPTID